MDTKTLMGVAKTLKLLDKPKPKAENETIVSIIRIIDNCFKERQEEFELQEKIKREVVGYLEQRGN